MRKFILIFTFIFVAGTLYSEANENAPKIPLTIEMIKVLGDLKLISVDGEDVVLVEELPQNALMKCGICSNIMDGVRLVKEVTGGATEYALDGAEFIVEGAGDIVKYTVDKSTDGIVYVIEKSGDAVKFSIDFTIDGAQFVLEQTGDVVKWTVENTLRDVTWDGKTYISFDPLREQIKATVTFPLEVTSDGFEVVQNVLNDAVDEKVSTATGIVDIVDGVVFLTIDVAVWTVDAKFDVSKELASLDLKGAAVTLYDRVKVGITNILQWGELGLCGSVAGGYWENGYKTDIIIPDYWPPDEILTNVFTAIVSMGASVNEQSCRLQGLSRMYRGCRVHDECYGVPGITKKHCDDQIKEIWYEQCGTYSTYRCRSTCEFNMDIYHNLMVGKSQTAYEAAQEKSDNDPKIAQAAIDSYNQVQADYYGQKPHYESDFDYTGNTKPIPEDFGPKSYIIPVVVAKPENIVPNIITPLLLN